jgi:DNA-binding transcriptional LysR family regulator
MEIEDLSLGSLKYFLDSVELGSMTQSAQKNHVSRPAISQAILRLEQWYGKPLLEHGKRTFTLTAAGRDFYRIARRSFDQLQNTLNSQENAPQSLRIGCSTSLLDFIYPKIGKYLREADSLEMKFGTTERLIEFLKDGTINVAFGIDNGEYHSFQSYDIHKGSFLLLSKTGRFEENLITTDDRPETKSFQKFAVKKKLKFKSHLQVEVWSVGIQFAQLSPGCCLVPDCLHPSNLKIVKTPGWKSNYTVRAFARKPHELSSLENEMMDSVIK